MKQRLASIHRRLPSHVTGPYAEEPFYFLQAFLSIVLRYRSPLHGCLFGRSIITNTGLSFLPASERITRRISRGISLDTYIRPSRLITITLIAVKCRQRYEDDQYQGYEFVFNMCTWYADEVDTSVDACSNE